MGEMTEGGGDKSEGAKVSSSLNKGSGSALILLRAFFGGSEVKSGPWKVLSLSKHRPWEQ